MYAHGGMTDIWVRYRDVEKYRQQHGDDMSFFNHEHESVWLAPYEHLPSIKNIVFELMHTVQGTRLGGVLITKLPPGAKIHPHRDGGWHAGYYEKYYVAVKNAPGAVFCWEGEEIKAVTGDCYRFRNDTLHWVNNDSNEERIAMIICIRRT